MKFTNLTNPFWLVLLGAIPGAVLRYLLGLYTPHVFNLPIGTLLANILGSFVLGALVTLFRMGVTTSNMLTMVGIGFCGSLTTMSTFAVESINLIDTSILLFLINVASTLVLVFLGAYVGRILAVYIYLSDE